MSAPCPCCDLDAMGPTPLMAHALGVALGVCFQDMHRVTELMCPKHRSTYVIAMAHASVAINRRDDDDEPFADEGSQAGGSGE